MLISIRQLTRKALIKFAEKQFTYDNHKLKYIFKRYNSNILIVVFSAFAGKGQIASYNFMRTLKSIKVNKLFILDDFGYEKRGTYYLGENKDFFVEKGVDKLIVDVKNNLNIKKTIYMGSSKGGSAALYFGFKHGVDYIIAGAPQFYYGNYLNTEPHKDLLEAIMGDATKESVDALNSLLLNKIENNRKKIKIYLHYSKNEHTYEEHVKYLISELDKNRCSCKQDVARYSNHMDVGKYFPSYMLNILKKEIL